MTGEVQKGLLAAAVLNRPESDCHLLFLTCLDYSNHFACGAYCAFPFPNVQQGGEFAVLLPLHLFSAQEGNFGFVPHRQEV